MASARQFEEIRERWRRSGDGWRRRADEVRAAGMPVSAWMLDQLDLHPGQDVLELAAGPGDTGFMAAELVRPGGRLICTDAVEQMLAIARDRAPAQGIDNVEFELIELEWIDLPTASVDAVLCRWGIMFLSDPGAAAREIRRSLRPGGRVALAVWDAPEHNPWATIPTRALVELGHVQPPDPDAPGMFTFADRRRLRALLEDAGFTDVVVEPVEIDRPRSTIDGYLEETSTIDGYLEETLDLSRPFADVWGALSSPERRAVADRIRELAAPYLEREGSLQLPGRALGAAATA